MDERIGAERAGEETKEETKEYDQEEVKSAKEVVQYLTKTSKTLQIYLSNNPIHQKFISELSEKFQRHLDDFGPLRLRIKQFELLCSGQTIYENTNRMESLPFKLYIDGLRELSFHPGIEKEELITFLDVIGDRGEAVDDDIVTLFWEKHLVHVKYVVVDDLQGNYRTDEIKEMKTGAPSPERLHELFAQETASPPMDEPILSKKVEIPSLHLFRLTEEEIRKIKEEVRGEEHLDMVAELEWILFDILRIEQDLVLFSEILGIIDNIFGELLVRADFAHARAIPEFFREMSDPAKAFPPSILDLIQKASVRLAHPDRIAALREVVNECESDKLDHFFSLMVLFDKSVVPPLVELLGTIDKMKARRTLCDILIRLGGGEVDFLISKLGDDRWYLVRNLIYVLGKIGDLRMIKGFSRLIRHEDAKIRKEILHALDNVEDPRCHDLVIKLIDEADLSNRIYAIRMLAKKKARAALEPLMALSTAKSFEAKELPEKKEIFDAIGKIGGEEVIPWLQRFIKTGWSLFKNTPGEEAGMAAVFALQRIGGPAAVAALREGSGSKSKPIREACARVLDLMKSEG